jgi:hypothetical protein
MKTPDVRSLIEEILFTILTISEGFRYTKESTTIKKVTNFKQLIIHYIKETKKSLKKKENDIIKYQNSIDDDERYDLGNDIVNSIIHMPIIYTLHGDDKNEIDDIVLKFIKKINFSDDDENSDSDSDPTNEIARNRLIDAMRSF